MKKSFIEKDLPIEYEPLVWENLNEGQDFGPVEFLVSENSHNKTVSMLEDSDLRGETKIETPYLLPSELWGLARVLSRYFGRINEAAGTQAEWKILRGCFSEEKLTASTKVVSKEKKRGLEYVVMETETKNSTGYPILKSKDTVLLFYDAPEGFYKEKERQKIFFENTEYERKHKVYFRHKWDPKIWKNNLHTDKYARKFGYERGLPEFITYMDWIFLIPLSCFGDKAYDETSMQTKIILPMYEGENIDVSAQRQDNKYKVQFIRKGSLRVLANVDNY
jgi:hypothetical protein